MRSKLSIVAALIGTCFAMVWQSAHAADPVLAAGPKVTITSITQSLPSLPQYTQVELPIYRDKVPKWSNGRVVFQPSTWAESSVSGNDILRLIRGGQAEIGASPFASVSGDLPFLEVVDLAGASPTIEMARRITDAVIPEANKQLAKFGVRIIGSYPFPANIMFCREPIKSLADLKARKVRTFGPSQSDLMSQLGAQSVNIGFPEVYPALSTGVADCAITAALSGNAAKWPEVTRSMYDLPISWGTGGYFVNLKWWNSQAPEVRQFIEAVYAQITEAEWKLGADGTAAGVACNIGDTKACHLGTVVTKNPMTVVEPTDADKAKLRDVLQNVIVPRWVKRCGADCGKAFNESVAPVVGFKYEGK
jgi:TRAP-type C4-dicarboxylate transport system substrate-binding protein